MYRCQQITEKISGHHAADAVCQRAWAINDISKERLFRGGPGAAALSYRQKNILMFLSYLRYSALHIQRFCILVSCIPYPIFRILANPIHWPQRNLHKGQFFRLIIEDDLRVFNVGDPSFPEKISDAPGKNVPELFFEIPVRFCPFQLH